MSWRALIGRDHRHAGRMVEVEARFIVNADALARLEAHGLVFSDPIVQDDQAYAPAQLELGR